MDVIYFLIRIGLSALLVLMTALTGKALPRQEFSLVSHQPIWLQALEFLLLTDLITYWVHRLEHELAVLWPIHAVHHSAESIDWLVAARNHPLELVLQKTAGSVPLYLLGFSPDLFAVLVPAIAANSLLLHANLTWDYGPLGYLFASPAFHRWHHSTEPAALDKNYAQVFSFYDFLFGTAYFPKGVHSSQYGLTGEPLPPRIVAHLLHPFQRWWEWLRVWSRRRSGSEQGVEVG
jgi:sterol desaturase/sphingolipid hydroxylase (fatty acid hydroxylase superfamily)